ncbi:hypothetical protein KFL_002370170 [Klebsormidium nitens]|uniref:Uncharacterized protein n=1 Tax=Klebsormidium nitens TaxID=105231 RepID=A0A1Y1I4R0_KLENI|nr:hypothetical protein KFL_002370170 [Klebsormidium nitens]|eukprot:GAQ85483.1 hypothetical protein KFL_002370170 [Klebsormidium nitens]
MAADLTRLAQESPEWCLASDVKLLAWLKGFSQEVTQRTELLTGRIEALSHDASVAQADLRNVFTSLHQLSNTQFIEQRVQDEDEISAPSSPPPQRASRPPIAPGPESFEQNVVPKYREAVEIAWRVLKSADCPSTSQPLETNSTRDEGLRSGPSSTSQTREAGLERIRRREWLDRPLPLILGTDAFLADEFCGLPPPDTEEYRPPLTESYERERREGHFAGPREDQVPSVPEKGGEKGLDSQSEGGDVEDGWTQISSRKDYSEVEPAVSAALNFRAMLEEALRGPSGIYEDVSSPSTRRPTHEGESDPATSASHDEAPGATNRESHDATKSTKDLLNKRGGGSEASMSSRSHGERRSASGFLEETKQGLESQREGDGAQSSGSTGPQDKAKRVVFSEDAHEERPVGFKGGEGRQAESAEQADGPSGKSTERSYGAFGDDWDNEEFSFGSSTSKKGKPSYTLDLDDLFKRKPRTAPLPNGSDSSSGTFGEGAFQGPAESQVSSNGLGWGLGGSSQASGGVGPQTVKTGSGVGLGGKNAAMDAVTAALKQRQAASKGSPEKPSENWVSQSVSADWVRTPSADVLGEPVSVDFEDDRAVLDETGVWSPSLTNPPLRTELSFGPVEDHTEGGEATGREQDRSGAEEPSDVRKSEDLGRLRNGDDWEAEASDGFPAGGGRLHGRLEAETESVRAADSALREGAGFHKKGEENTEADRAKMRSEDTGGKGDSETAQVTVREPGGNGGETGSGRLFGVRNDRAETKGGEASTSGGQNLGFGKGGARSKLFGDSDEEDDCGLPLFGGKLGQRPGGKRRGLFEDSDEEAGGLGFGRRSTGLFGNGYGLAKDGLGGQKQSTGLFGDSEKATGGLFSSDRGEGDVSSARAAKSAAEGSPKSDAAKAARKADEGLFGAPQQQTALSADLFGDDEEDGDLFGLSGLGRHSRDKAGFGEAGPKRTTGISAFLESTYSSDEEDPWEGRLAKLKEGQD